MLKERHLRFKKKNVFKSWSYNPDRLDDWFRKIPGKFLLDTENELLANLLPHLFGYYLVQLGGPSNKEWLNRCRIPMRIHLSEQPLDSPANSSVICDFTELPFLPDNIDVALLPHVLEFATHPEEILTEVYQALIPEGHIVILGFHPWSLWGLAKLFKRNQKSPWSGKFHSSYRVRYWLKKMGYSVIDHETLFFRPPLNNATWLQRLYFFEGVGQLLWSYLGGVYLIVAKKRVTTLTPIQSRLLLKKKNPVPHGMAQPSARSSP